MRSINELGLDLGSVEVRKRVIDFLTGADVEFKYPGLDSTDHKGKIIGYRNEIGGPSFSIIILAVGEDFPVGWPYVNEFDTIISGVNSKTEKAFTHISYIQIPDILADALVAFITGKTISGLKVFNDWKVSKSYLSSSNGFKY